MVQGGDLSEALPLLALQGCSTPGCIIGEEKHHGSPGQPDTISSPFRGDGEWAVVAKVFFISLLEVEVRGTQVALGKRGWMVGAGCT